MNEKEIAALRRRLRPEKSNITHVRGCYVNGNREMISQFNQSTGLMGQEDAETYHTLFRKVMSGGLGRNLIDIEFATRQVAEGEEHKLLSALRSTKLEDQEAVDAFYRRVMDSLTLEGNYLILLAHNTYDIPYRGKDGEEQEDASSQVFSYLLCAVCPVKDAKPALSYCADQREFHIRGMGSVAGSPELGFLFPAFDDGGANIYNALYYTKSLEESHQEFVDAVFRAELPMPAQAQKVTFQGILEDTLAEDCSYRVVRAVHDQLSNLVEEHKASKRPEPLSISREQVADVLESCGVAGEHVSSFEERFDAAFGEDTQVSPANLVETKKLQVSTPDVVIQVNPMRGDLVQTRVIDGAKYILVRVEEGVEVNGVNVHIAEKG